jgi:hypothetical protein
VLSTDDFFIDRYTGAYKFDGTRLDEAHEWNQEEGELLDLI